MSSAHQAIHVIKEKEGKVNRDFLEEITDLLPSSFGAACAFSPDEDMDVKTMPGQADLDELDKTQEKFKEDRVIFSFEKHPEGSPEDETQPYVLLKDPNGGALVVAFIDGEFPGYEKTDSAYSSAYHFTIDFLKKKVKEIFISCNGVTTEMLKKFQADDFKKEVSGQAGVRCAVTLLTYDDKVLTIEKKNEEHAGDYPEFWTSDKLSYEEEKEEEKKDDDEFVVEKHPKPVAKPTETKTESAKPVMVRCPTTIHKNSDIRQWYKTHAGFVPGNYKNRPEVPSAKGVTPPARPLDKVEERINNATKPANNLPAQPPKAPAEKKIDTTASEYFHIIPPEELNKYFKEFAVRTDIKGLVDASGNPLPFDPKTYQSSEGRWSTFLEVSKIKSLIDLGRWSDVAIMMLIKNHQRFAFKLMKDLIRSYMVSQISKGSDVVTKSGKAA